MHFRAFLDTINDNYTSEWNSTKYVGRGENFYTYQGFDRKVSFGFTVAAQSKVELMPMYRKLNFLKILDKWGFSVYNIVIQITLKPKGGAYDGNKTT